MGFNLENFPFNETQMGKKSIICLLIKDGEH